MEKTNITKAKESVSQKGKCREFLSKIFERDFKILNDEHIRKLDRVKAEFVHQVRFDPNFMKYPEYEMDLFEWREDSPAGDLTWNPEMVAARHMNRPTSLQGTAAMAGLPPLPTSGIATPNNAVNQRFP